MKRPVYFERALFFSWYCGLGDCTFCYMSTLKDNKADPKTARRRFSSIFAEALISKVMGWKIEFISGGYDSYTKEELVYLVKGVYEITGQKQWLNLGTLSKKELELFKPYIEGFAGTIETVNWDLRKKVCPSKVLPPIFMSFKFCDELEIKKSITIIIGLGETEEDIPELINFVREHHVDKITFYALNPHPGTCFKNSPEKDYYATWIRKTREAYPDLPIVAGAWLDKTDYYQAVLEAGATSITKIPSIRKFGSKEVRDVVKSVEEAGCEFQGTLTDMPDVNWEQLVADLPSETFDEKIKEEILGKLNSYLKKMRKGSITNN